MGPLVIRYRLVYFDCLGADSETLLDSVAQKFPFPPPYSLLFGRQWNGLGEPKLHLSARSIRGIALHSRKPRNTDRPSLGSTRRFFRFRKPISPSTVALPLRTLNFFGIALLRMVQRVALARYGNASLFFGTFCDGWILVWNEDNVFLLASGRMPLSILCI